MIRLVQPAERKWFLSLELEFLPTCKLDLTLLRDSGTEGKEGQNVNVSNRYSTLLHVRLFVQFLNPCTLHHTLCFSRLTSS